VNRDLELRIKAPLLYEIATVDGEVFGSRQGFSAVESGYSKTLESVVNCAGSELVAHLDYTLVACRFKDLNVYFKIHALRVDRLVQDDFWINHGETSKCFLDIFTVQRWIGRCEQSN
jgi:hypothetical protein